MRLAWGQFNYSRALSEYFLLPWRVLAQERPKRGPKEAQERPREAQRAQERPKRAPRKGKGRPRVSPNNAQELTPNCRQGSTKNHRSTSIAQSSRKRVARETKSKQKTRKNKQYLTNKLSENT